MARAQVSAPDPYEEFRATQQQTRRGGAPCSLNAAVAGLAPERADALRRALHDAGITTKTIQRVLSSWGLDIQPGVLRRHRPWQQAGDRCVTCLG